jgi:GNAT superfamily N-acetyltransferase
MNDTANQFVIRPMVAEEWDDVATLIHDSTNAWYESQGRSPIFTAGPASTRLFCEVYEALDPGCCLVAMDAPRGKLAGSCFYHPRPTHISLGIMNVHPSYFGHGVGRHLLHRITDLADRSQLPVRLVSSALNLDSFSLYNRSSFVPQAVYQDMMLDVPGDVPGDGLADLAPKTNHVRRATQADVASMVDLEMELIGLNRQRDFQYFCENALGIWETRVLESSTGTLDGFIVSVRHPASCMIGPGAMRSEADAIALVGAALDQHRGGKVLVVTPSKATRLVQFLYALGARNSELHLSQVRGPAQPEKGILIPTFMPETG